jgi:diketogulonate reductase-like aldo/keto reductase
MIVKYDDKQYLIGAKMLQEDARVTAVGLCNFDTQRMEEIAESGVNIVSNQVQVNFPSTHHTFVLKLIYSPLR